MHSHPTFTWPPSARGFTLIEMLVTVAIIGILSVLAYPSYLSYTVRSSRAAVQAELLNLASAQEKIYLNSSLYTPSVTCPYNGSASSAASIPNCPYYGLGSSATSKDGNYSYSLSISTPSASVFTLTATPVAGGTQASDGSLSIDQSGSKVWNASTGVTHW